MRLLQSSSEERKKLGENKIQKIIKILVRDQKKSRPNYR